MEQARGPHSIRHVRPHTFGLPPATLPLAPQPMNDPRFLGVLERRECRLETELVDHGDECAQHQAHRFLRVAAAAERHELKAREVVAQQRQIGQRAAMQFLATDFDAYRRRTTQFRLQLPHTVGFQRIVRALIAKKCLKRVVNALGALVVDGGLIVRGNAAEVHGLNETGALVDDFAEDRHPLTVFVAHKRATQADVLDVHGDVQNVQERGHHEPVVIPAADDAAQRPVQKLNIVRLELAGVEAHPHAALLASLKRTDLHQDPTAAKEHVEVQLVPLAARIGDFAAPVFDCRVQSFASLGQQVVSVVFGVHAPGQEVRDLVHDGQVDDGFEFHINIRVRLMKTDRRFVAAAAS